MQASQTMKDEATQMTPIGLAESSTSRDKADSPVRQFALQQIQFELSELFTE